MRYVAWLIRQVDLMQAALLSALSFPFPSFPGTFIISAEVWLAAADADYLSR